MRLLEHQSKYLLGRFGVPFTRPRLAADPDEAARVFESIEGDAVLKAQVPFGGRGKAGAIRFAATTGEARSHAAELFKLELSGFPVRQITLEPKVGFSDEMYLGVTWDLRNRCPVAVFNPAGGVEVEAAADRAVTRSLDPRRPLSPFEARELVHNAGIRGKDLVTLGTVMAKLTDAFLALDAITLEINPLARTSEGAWVGLDAHVELDDDAAVRLQPHLEPLGEIPVASGRRPPTPLESEAARIDAMDHRGVAGRLVEFDGSLALLIGGGGASLTVFDAVLRHGGRPANYCEIGGNPTEEKVAALTKLLLGKPGVDRLAVIMNVVNNTRANVMAHGVIRGILDAGREPSQILSVFRIPGSWEDEAVAFLRGCGVTALGREVSLDEAARQAVQSQTPSTPC